MKKQYTKPSMEVEIYELNTNIAANCEDTINFGPGIPGSTEEQYRTCSDYEDGFSGGFDPIFFMSGARNKTSFYDEEGVTCDCYYTSGGEGFFTS